MSEVATQCRRRGVVISPSTISRIERGGASLTNTEAVIMAAVLGLDTSVFELSPRALEPELELACDDLDHLLEEGKRRQFRLDFVGAASCYRTAMERASRIADHESWALAAARMVDVLRRQGYLGSSLQLLRTYLCAASLSTTARLRGLVLLSHHATITSDSVLASAVMRKVVPVLSDAHPSLRSFALASFGIDRLLAADYSRALELLGRAYRISLEHGPDDYVWRIQVSLAFAQAKTGRKSQAIEILGRCVERATELDYLDTGAVALDYLARLNVHLPDVAKTIAARQAKAAGVMVQR